ncbi:hypothetical protein [Spartinivicinus poritis]|uniref:Lipoprotein n=1 Tax=Spartinivicinus poritis TaxID=2994640 RepID=A0ABT5UG82_9GAMM|nr:hypothetical protein [Spartinivicinus sp. A2-2]MDE1465401.1 hypothetical protein [Spartinivicinus sp. A2-2]
MNKLCSLQYIYYWLVTVIITILLVGCSFQSLIIRNIPSLVADRIADTLALSSLQEKSLEKELKVLLTNEKPRIVKIKAFLKNISVSHFDANQVHQYIAENYFEVAKQVNILLAKYMLLLNTKQKLAMYANFSEENEAFSEKIEDYDVDGVFDRFQFFTGSLTDKQKAMITNKMAVFKSLLEERLARRLDTQSQIAKILDTDVPDKQAKLISLLNQKAIFYPANKNRKQIILLINQIVSSTNKEQIEAIEKSREKLIGWLDDYLIYY